MYKLTVQLFSVHLLLPFMPQQQSFILNRTPCTSYQCQRTPTTWKIAKIFTIVATRSPNTPVHCILISESPRKTQHCQVLWKNVYSHTRMQSKTNSNGSCKYLIARRYPWQPMQSNWPMCTPPLPWQKDSTQSSGESEILKARCLPKVH